MLIKIFQKLKKIKFFVLLLVFINLKSYGQEQKKLEKLIQISSIEMYENPEKVISVGNNIVKLSKNNIDIKIKAYKLISDGYSSKRDYQKSLNYLVKALKLLPKTKDELLKISIETKAGIQYHQLKIYQNAITYLDRAEEMCANYPEQDSVKVFLGVNYLVRGFIYKEKLNCDIAISFFDKGIKQLLEDKRIKENSGRISIAKYNKGNCFLLLGQNKLAEKSFKEALEYANSVNAKSLQAFAKKGIAQIHTINGDYKEAIKILNEAYTIAQNVNDLILNQEIYKGLSENYLAINQQDKYNEYQKKLILTQNIVKENERASISNLLIENKINFEKKSKRDSSKFWIFFLIFSSIISITITFFLIKNLNKNIFEIKDKIFKINKNFSNNKTKNP